ncbi:MAG TPA: hypothetical protein VMD79_02230 [Solirubrobacteraceae bacterium]|nr:hypothetical protein [Solirubrobacteraceae bacterium]
MQGDTSKDQDWRLRVELDAADAGALDAAGGGGLDAAGTGGALHTILARLRGSEGGMLKEIEATVPHDVVVTHDGKRLFAYAADEATLAQARSAIEAVLAHEAITARVSVGCWDEELDEWRQTDPPLSAALQAHAETARRDAETAETRTLVASSGKLIRGEFEETMHAWADKLGVECQVIEHPHLLSTQVAFTVSGPRYKLDEFARGLKAEEWATIRTETGIMTSPL